MPTPKFFGRVDGGAIEIRDKSEFMQYLRRLEGKDVEIVVRRFRGQRSLDANAFYWGAVVTTMADEFGYDKQEMHDVLAMRFLRIADCPITQSPRRKHTPECDTKEFAEYVDACIRLAAEHGVYIPQPGEVEV